MEKRIRFNEWAAEWLRMKSGMVKSNTFEATYRNSVENHLVPEFGCMFIDEIKPIELQIFLNLMIGKYSTDTVKKFKSCLNQLFEEAVWNGLCKRNPCDRLKIPKKNYNLSIEQSDGRIYSIEQMKLIKEYAVQHRFGYEVFVLIETGIRRGELLGLPWKYVDFEHNVIYIRQAAAIVKENGINTVILGLPKTSTSIRDIPISAELSTILLKQKKKAASDFVVSTGTGGVINPRTWQRRHYDVFMNDMQFFYKGKGIDMPIYTPHRLRHSRTSEWVNADCNLFAVAKTLGHSNLEMLHKVYAHSDIEETRQLLNIY